MKEKLYTAGEIADMAGVSLRTIRFYDAKGLLKPVSYSEAGYRYYDRNSLLSLQRIIMLKYLGFPLSQIHEIMMKDDDVEAQIASQKELLLQKKSHLEELISTIDLWQNSQREEKWDVLLHLLSLMSDDEKVKEQYTNADNLQKRINIHVYSTGEENWFDWVYRHMEIKPGMKILELGCGTGLLWKHNLEKLPEGIHLVLSDRSEGMLNQTKEQLQVYENYLKEHDIKIEYLVMDADKLYLREKSYDLIIANHMLYHVKERKNCLLQCRKALQPGGKLLCSTVGREHMQELHDFVERFDSKIEVPFKTITESFMLENAQEQLKEVFETVLRYDHDSDLLVDDAEAIYHYVASFPGNAAYILEQRREEFIKPVIECIEKEGAFFIHKSTGIFVCTKN